MKLIDKPHCRKHEVYAQGCIGCRIKARPHQVANPDIHDLNFVDYLPGLEPAPVGSTPGSDMAVERPDADTDHLESAKKLLKSIYNDGAEGNRRSLTHDLETLQNLLNAGQQA